jgi:hypothetical protein
MTTILKFKGANDDVVSVGRTTGLIGDKYHYVEDTKPSAEQMLKKALEFANQGMSDNPLYICERDIYADGKYYAYEDMAAHLEMLIKEAKQ